MNEIYLFGKIKPRDYLKSDKDISKILNDAFNKKREMRDYPVSKIIELLDKLSNLWLNPSYPFRKKALEIIPTLSGFHPSMINEEINFLCDLLKKENLEKRIKCELGSLEVLDGWTNCENLKGRLRIEPLGIVLHVGAGNVFVGPLDSLIQGIITKNINILKMSSDDPVFPVLFLKSLQEIDEDKIVSSSISALSWKGGSSIEDIFKKRADAIVVYGGKEAVLSYRNNLGFHTRLIEYGPKYSLILISKEVFKVCNITKLANEIAFDASRWEQSACSSPHVIYIEGKNSQKFIKELGNAFSNIQKTLPQKKLSIDEEVEIVKIRSLAKTDKVLGSGELFEGQNWTIIFEQNPEFKVSCLNRTLYIKEVESLDDAIDAIKPYGLFLQTIAISAPVDKRKKLADELSFIGADRFTEVGKMTFRHHGVPHDGVYSLERLIRRSSLTGNSYLEENETFSKLNDLIRYVKKHSIFYREKFKNLKIKSIDDFNLFPIINPDELKKNLPPENNNAITRKPTDGYVFTSGGTTGAPKFVFRSYEEQEYNASFLAKGLLAGGLVKGSLAANLLFSGNMWGSFISFNKALEKAGCQILPVGGNISMEDILRYLEIFKPDVILAIPSVLLSIAGIAEKRKISLKTNLIFTGGEHIFKENMDYLKGIFNTKKIASIGYATNDVGAIGYQCHFLDGGLHHIHEDLQYIEIIDIETNMPISTTETGKIVVTNLNRRLQPIIRYDVGDMGRWVDINCPCGDKARVLELLGRSDDVLIIGGGNIHPDVIRSAIEAVNGLSGVFSLTAKLKGHQDELNIMVEAFHNVPESDYRELSGKLKEKILENSKELRTMTIEKLINPIKVKLMPSGSIPRNPRTGKIRLINDERF